MFHGRYFSGGGKHRFPRKIWYEYKISLRCEILNKNDDIDSALAHHIIENPGQVVLFDEATLIFEANDFPLFLGRQLKLGRIHK